MFDYTPARLRLAPQGAADARSARTPHIAPPSLFDRGVGAQRTFDELGTPLHEVTFCVLDLETTGGSYATDAITEIGAVKLRGGECLGRFETLVNPGVAIPPL